MIPPTAYASPLDLMSYLTEEQKANLASIAKDIVKEGRGILAADESNPTVGKRFAGINLENSEENRRLFRQMLFTAPDLEKYVGGVIFFDETFGQKDDSGKRFVDLLKSKGIKVGIKLDKGLVDISGTKEEKFTQGFDGLMERAKAFADGGAEFAKWRCVLKISVKDQTPSDLSYFDVSHTLAKYALICQANGLVPIVEPEVLIDGEHTLDVAQKVTERILGEVYQALRLYGVYLEGTLLKPNMVTPGQSCPIKYKPEDIARATVTALARGVPSVVPGITFLSGGQSEKDATINLNAINSFKGLKPWALTFSFARALQNSAVESWAGKKENLAKAHHILVSRAKFNSLASTGKYNPAEDVSESAKGSLYAAGHTY